MSNISKKPRLGKGLEALIPKNALISGKSIINIPIDEIKPNPSQPRIIFKEESIESLSESIQQHGLAQPILVRKKEDYYELIAGERRFRACKIAKIQKIPAIIKNISDKDSLQIALIENIKREDLNPIEEAIGFKRLVIEFGFTHQELSKMIGKSRSSVTNTMRLLKLPKFIQKALLKGILTEGHARVLLSLNSENEILAKYNEITKEGLNVRETEIIANNTKKPNTSQMSLFPQIEQELSNKYNAPVNVKGTRRKGKVIINYSNAQQRDQIFTQLRKIS